MELSQKLVALRKKSGMTQQELAEKVYVTRTAVSKWENGKGYPAIDSLKLLSKVYGVSLDELVSDEDVAAARARRQNRSKIFYWCAVGCLVLAAAFAAAAGFSHIPWFAIPSGAGVAGYVAFAFLTKPSLSGCTRAQFTRYIVSRIVVLAIVVAVLIATFVQLFA